MSTISGERAVMSTIGQEANPGDKETKKRQRFRYRVAILDQVHLLTKFHLYLLPTRRGFRTTDFNDMGKRLKSDNRRAVGMMRSEDKRCEKIYETTEEKGEK
jgi:hypothetical protein